MALSKGVISPSAELCAAILGVEAVLTRFREALLRYMTILWSSFTLNSMSVRDGISDRMWRVRRS